MRNQWMASSRAGILTWCHGTIQEVLVIQCNTYSSIVLHKGTLFNEYICMMLPFTLKSGCTKRVFQKKNSMFVIIITVLLEVFEVNIFYFFSVCNVCRIFAQSNNQCWILANNNSNNNIVTLPGNKKHGFVSDVVHNQIHHKSPL